MHLCPYSGQVGVFHVTEPDARTDDRV
jgi:hypothetical protein